MTQTDIFDAAMQSHLDVYALGRDRSHFIYRLEAFAKLVAAKEREACAKVCIDETMGCEPIAYTLAESIRARGKS
jgi:hypothetical protein